MDADYYFNVAIQLQKGNGFSEMILWNYLDDPPGLPHPSNSYWMPLPSIVSFLGMRFTSSTDFLNSRCLFFGIAALIPPITYALSYRLLKKDWQAFLAGLLALFPGFYLPFLVTTDSFALGMFLGGLYFLTVDQLLLDIRMKVRIGLSFLLGIISAFLYLNRADGLLWLLCGLVLIFTVGMLQKVNRNLLSSIVLGFTCLAGFLIITGPWFVRNLSAFGTPFSPAARRLLWLTEYNQLFVYPADTLNFASWLSSGVRDIARDRAWAFGQNLQTLVAIQGGILLVPLVLLGIQKHKRNPLLWTALLGWLVTFLIMTLLFPYAGGRGGYFHSGSVLQPLWWAIVPAGLQAVLDWGQKVRSWSRDQAERFLSAGIVTLLFLITLFLSYERIIGGDLSNTKWDQAQIEYRKIETRLLEFGADISDIALVNNAPGYHLASGRPSISIPFGDLNSVLNVASRYNASYLILELAQVTGSEDLYTNPGNRDGLIYLGTEGESRIYQMVH